MTHLILHKVRGEPAFDVAEQMEIAGEKAWIIPTSGHRAYPYRTWPINDLYYEDQGCIMESAPPEGWPDHYSNESSATASKGKGMKLNIASILRPFVQIKRRI